MSEEEDMTAPDWTAGTEVRLGDIKCTDPNCPDRREGMNHAHLNGAPIRFTLTVEPNGDVMCSICGLIEQVDMPRRGIDFFYPCPHLKGSFRIVLETQRAAPQPEG